MMPSATIIVPTYREADNLTALLTALERVKRTHRLDLEVLIMDDDSQDGTDQVIKSLQFPWVQLITRNGPRGLSQAVLEGFQKAKQEAIIVMDADLSHPVDVIPQMLTYLKEGYDMVIGSRYIDGASLDEKWSPWRRLFSRLALFFATPLTDVKDSMSGFFAFPKSLLHKSAPLNPTGYKIGLELLVKAPIKRIKEIPIHFADRTQGESKLSLTVQLRCLQHLRRLYLHRFPKATTLLHFLFIGFLGIALATLFNYSLSRFL